jgi:hypothetical protein
MLCRSLFHAVNGGQCLQHRQVRGTAQELRGSARAVVMRNGVISNPSLSLAISNASVSLVTGKAERAIYSRREKVIYSSRRHKPIQKFLGVSTARRVAVRGGTVAAQTITRRQASLDHHGRAGELRIPARAALLECAHRLPFDARNLLVPRCVTSSARVVGRGVYIAAHDDQR